ncbi:hypothetical protein [Xanthomonas sp. XNM01]|uniref:hypothetical protein n=1 Tax=Xanthomonas sp. XNM01 TaxID=2769289 RepID=UPI00177E4107|nr:hypothetical protein [Xanthomonas sp. XNM01]MBD9370422.1 hypothetical protein [Xanthomonas sp. XNM01]
MPTPLAFLFGSVPVSFRSAHPLQDAVERLRAATTPRTLIGPRQPAMLGRVEPDDVALSYKIPMVHNAFKPVFRGRFEQDADGVALVGRFTMQGVVRALLALWLGFGLLWTGGALALILSGAAVVAMAWLFPLAGVGLLLVGLGLVRLGQHLGRHDADAMSQRIRAALGS